MLIKNILKPGDYLIPVPTGLPLTVEYDYNGTISKCYIGWKEDKKLLDKEFIKFFKSCVYCPTHIALKTGRSEVSGVLYTNEYSMFDEGSLPDCIETSIFSNLQANPNKFKFFALNIESLSTVFKGANSTLNWLNMNGFEALPGFIVPANFTKRDMRKLMDTDRFRKYYNSGLISNYFIYRGSDTLTTSINARQFITSRVSTYIDEFGCIKCDIFTKSQKTPFATLNYSDVVSYQIQTNTLVVLDDDNDITYTICTDNKKRDNRSTHTYCQVCGKPFDIPKHGLVYCPDLHCKSKWLPIINKMLNIFKLPKMSKSRFDSILPQLVQISDIFELDEYCNCKIEASLSDILISLLPVITPQTLKVIHRLTARCKNISKSFLYYVNNPSRISTDIDCDPNDCLPLIRWLSDSYNQHDVEALIDLPNLTITSQGKSFDGPPIFRDKTIMLTGSFHHGSYDDVKSIIESYDATVVDELSPLINCLVIGDILENVDSRCVNYCKNNHIPVMTERQFFERYEIDKDMAENLV